MEDQNYKSISNNNLIMKKGSFKKPANLYLSDTFENDKSSLRESQYGGGNTN